MVYLTFGEPVTGVYEGQVIGVCQHLKAQYGTDIRLVAFISIRGFSAQKQKLQARLPDAIVLPMLPKIQLWALNVITLALFCLFYRPKNIICRNVLATNLALRVRKMGLLKKVCYDGRGAMAAEWSEYDVVPSASLKKAIVHLESNAILKSDFRIAVSSKLIAHWQEKFSFKSDKYVVIPCTLSSHFAMQAFSDKELIQKREEMGYQAEDIIFIYAGSTAGWQSFDVLKPFLEQVLAIGNQYKVVFLSKVDENNTQLLEKFPKQVAVKWVNPNEVQTYLGISDYGILLRENTVTNQVAAPTKFAEYLASGLNVIISPNLGDYSDLVIQTGCGKLISVEALEARNNFSNTNYEARQKNVAIAQSEFTKTATKNDLAYQKLVAQMA